MVRVCSQLIFCSNLLFFCPLFSLSFSLPLFLTLSQNSPFLTFTRHVEELERTFNYDRTFNFTTKKTAMEAFRPEPPIEYLNRYPPEMQDSFRKVWRITVWNENYDLNLKASMKTQDTYNKRHVFCFYCLFCFYFFYFHSFHFRNLFPFFFHSIYFEGSQS